jgi:hypothetical protein
MKMEFNFENMFGKLFETSAEKAERFEWTEEGYLVVIGNGSAMANTMLACCQKFDTSSDAVISAFKASGIEPQKHAVMLSPEFWDNTPIAFRNAVVAHEVGHLRAGHLYSEKAAGVAGVLNIDEFEIEADDYAARKCGAKVMEDALRFTVDLIIEKQVAQLVVERGAKVGKFGHKSLVFISKWAALLSPQLRARFKALRALQKAGF